MPRLINPQDFDIFAPQIHQMVSARDDVEVSEPEARLFEGNSIFMVFSPPDESEIATSDESDADVDVPAESRPSTRRQVTRGARRAEINTAPAMETR